MGMLVSHAALSSICFWLMFFLYIYNVLFLCHISSPNLSLFVFLKISTTCTTHGLTDYLISFDYICLCVCFKLFEWPYHGFLAMGRVVKVIFNITLNITITAH